MSKKKKTVITSAAGDRSHEYRQFLSQYTNARIALGHTGGHLQIRDWLEFQKGFVQAKDALISVFDSAPLHEWCKENNLASMELTSCANQLELFLLRPDLGRKLTPESVVKLRQLTNRRNKDLLLIVSGGLSPAAIQHHAASFLSQFVNDIKREQWSAAPVMIIPRGRVALGDEINLYLHAKIVVMLIGERPGLSTPDSMGIYLTYDAKPGCNDSQRNCISNIHADGLSYREAAEKLVQLLRQSFRLRLTGVNQHKI